MRDFKFLIGRTSFTFNMVPLTLPPPVRNNPLPPPRYEPMRRDRFLVTFPIELNIHSHFVTSLRRPSYARDENGTIRWEDMVITLHDPIAPSVTQILNNYIGSNDALEGLQITIELLDPTGMVVSKWYIIGYISSIDWGNLSYDNDDLVNIKITMRVNNAVLVF